MMRKIGIGIFCVTLCLAIAFIFPQVGTTYEYVDATGCACHDFSGGPGSGLHDGTTHAASECTVCHEVGGDSPLTETCVVCHPAGNPGVCPLVNMHAESCLVCHDDCAGETTTTTADMTSTTTTPKKPCPLVKIYGEGSDEVAMLRYLRDNVLSQSEEGQEIIRLYYMWSPVIARALEDDDELAEELRGMVDGVLLSVIEE